MLDGKGEIKAREAPPKRIPFERIELYLQEVFAEFPEDYYGFFKLVEDYGIRMLTYGNAGSGNVIRKRSIYNKIAMIVTRFK